MVGFPALGEGEGTHVHTRVCHLTRAGHRLDLSPPSPLCPAPFALPGLPHLSLTGWLCSSVNRQRQKVNLQPDGLCLVTNHIELSKWEVSRHPLFLAQGSSSPALTGAAWDPATLAQHYALEPMADRASIDSKNYNFGGQ